MYCSHRHDAERWSETRRARVRKQKDEEQLLLLQLLLRTSSVDSSIRNIDGNIEFPFRNIETLEMLLTLFNKSQLEHLDPRRQSLAVLVRSCLLLQWFEVMACSVCDRPTRSCSAEAIALETIAITIDGTVGAVAAVGAAVVQNTDNLGTVAVATVASDTVVYVTVTALTFDTLNTVTFDGGAAKTPTLVTTTIVNPDRVQETLRQIHEDTERKLARQQSSGRQELGKDQHVANAVANFGWMKYCLSHVYLARALKKKLADVQPSSNVDGDEIRTSSGFGGGNHQEKEDRRKTEVKSNPKLAEYIKDAKAAGADDAAIKAVTDEYIKSERDEKIEDLFVLLRGLAGKLEDEWKERFSETTERKENFERLGDFQVLPYLAAASNHSDGLVDCIFHKVNTRNLPWCFRISCHASRSNMQTRRKWRVFSGHTVADPAGVDAHAKQTGA